MQYNEVVNKENEYKVYLCKLTNGRWIKTKERECVTPKAPTQEYLDWLDDFLSTWSRLATSVQDIQLDVAEQDYLNG